MKDCANLLVEKGFLHLSFVEGDCEISEYQTGNCGVRKFFYFHTQDLLTKELEANKFETIQLIQEKYQKDIGVEEFHAIIIARN